MKPSTGFALRGASVVFAFSMAASVGAQSGGGMFWNHVTPTIASSNDAAIERLTDRVGRTSRLRFQMIARFNSVDETGTLESGVHPAHATRDSLFGNTGNVNGLSGVLPSFKISGF